MNRISAAITAFTFSGVLFVPGLSRAQDVDDFGAYRAEHYEVQSPQDVAVELRFGRYVPDADQGVSGTPYNDIFGDHNRFYGGIEVDWQLLRIPYLGTLSPGFGIGYTKSSGKSPFASGLGLSRQKTSLEILPMYLVGVLRADVIARETAVPLVPYAKLGLGYALWRVTSGDEAARADGVVGRGHSYGPQFALGGMFLLDVLEREDARSADVSIGLNHSYLFAEWYFSDLDGFGANDQLQVGTNTWMVGLAFEF